MIPAGDLSVFTGSVPHRGVAGIGLSASAATATADGASRGGPRGGQPGVPAPQVTAGSSAGGTDAVRAQVEAAAAKKVEEERDETAREAGTRDELAGNSLVESSSLTVLLNEEADRFVYRSLDLSTRELIRQYPSESELRRTAFFRDSRGTLFDQSL